MKTQIRALISFCLLSVWLLASLPWEAMHHAMENVALMDMESDERDSEKNERDQKENEKENKEIESYDKDYVHALHAISMYDLNIQQWNLGHSCSKSSHIIEIQVPPPQFS